MRSRSMSRATIVATAVTAALLAMAVAVADAGAPTSPRLDPERRAAGSDPSAWAWVVARHPSRTEDYQPAPRRRRTLERRLTPSVGSSAAATTSCSLTCCTRLATGRHVGDARVTALSFQASVLSRDGDRRVDTGTRRAAGRSASTGMASSQTRPSRFSRTSRRASTPER